MLLLQRHDILQDRVFVDMHCPHFVLEHQKVDCVVPLADDLELVQKILGCLLRVERRTQLRKWRDPDIRDNADNKTVSLDFSHVVDFPVVNPCLVESHLFWMSRVASFVVSISDT